MTAPITPNPGIHKVPESTVTNSTPLFPPPQIETIALQLFNAFSTSIINAILNAFGLSAFDGPIDQALLALENALLGIPQTNVLGLGNLAGTVSTLQLALSTATAALNNAVDSITNVLGITGTNQLISTMESALTNGLGGLLPAVFNNLDGTGSILSTLITDLGDGTASLPSQLGNSPLATMVDALDGTAQSVAALLQNFTGGATPIISTAQTLADTITNVMTGGNSLGNPITQVETALQNIPFPNVLGTLGPSNLGASVETMVDSIWQGLTGGTATGNSLGALSNAATATANTASNAQTIAQTNSVTLTNQAVTQPSWQAIDPTANAVFPITTLTGSAPTTVGVTAANTVMGMVGTPNGGVLKSIVFLGQTTTNISGMWVNVYAVNTSTGALTLAYAGSNIISSVLNSLTWNYIPIPSANYITAAQGNWYAVEMQVSGLGGTYALAGIPNHWLPVNGSSAYPRQLGATRVTGAPAFDATASGTGPTFGGTSGSWTQTIAAAVGSGGAIYVVLNADASATGTCKVGATSMTQLAAFNVNVNGYILVFVLFNPPTGSQTISFTTGSSAFTVGISASFTGVTSTGTITTTASTGTAASQSATAPVGEFILQAFAWTVGTGTISAYNQTTIKNVAGAGNVNNPMVVGYAAGTGSSVSFTATGSVSAVWGGVAIPLIGTAPSPPGTISSPTGSANVPWFGLSGSAAPALVAPVTQEYSTAGTFTYTVPAWMVAGNHFDVIVLGGGGGGSQSAFGNTGQGGLGGTWNAVTLTYGTSMPTSTTTFSVTVGADGLGGIENGALYTNGGSSSVTVTGYGTLTGSGGAGAGNSGTQVGASPSNETFNGVTYYGGAAQTTFAPGNTPGGGGLGAANFGSGTNGAPGAVWIRAYQ